VPSGPPIFSATTFQIEAGGLPVVAIAAMRRFLSAAASQLKGILRMDEQYKM
jgi:hypothetical protein